MLRMNPCNGFPAVCGVGTVVGTAVGTVVGTVVGTAVGTVVGTAVAMPTHILQCFCTR